MQMVKSDVSFVNAHVIDESTTKIMEIRARMAEHLSPEQSQKLADVLGQVLGFEDESMANLDYLKAFLDAKRVEGCTPRTVKYYGETCLSCLNYLGKPIRSINANDIRSVLSWYKSRGCSDTTVNNVRRNLSTFFQWLENEDVIRKSPVKKVRQIRCEKGDKQPFSDIEIEKLRAGCESHRERAVIELLLSSGMRVGELVGLDISDMDFVNRQCEVFGKGRKRRTCYFSAAAEMSISQYLKTRNDDNPALFVSLVKKNGEHQRISISTVESGVRKLGKRVGVEKCHPHRFRRTMATINLRRGMNIEELQLLLGHEKVDTTLIYAKVDKEIVRTQARRFT